MLHIKLIKNPQTIATIRQSGSIKKGRLHSVITCRGTAKMQRYNPSEHFHMTDPFSGEEWAGGGGMTLTEADAYRT